MTRRGTSKKDRGAKRKKKIPVCPKCNGDSIYCYTCGEREIYCKCDLTSYAIDSPLVQNLGLCECVKDSRHEPS